MELQSLGYRTDLFFPRFDGEIIDRGDYLVVKTPRNPTFYWGNFILFPSPPGEDDYPRWREIFCDEIGIPPRVRHQCFGWDGIDGDAGNSQPFQDAGFRLDCGSVLTAETLTRPTKICAEIEVRPLVRDWEWSAALDNHVISRAEDQEEVSYRLFASRQLDRYRALAAAGHGDWFGAFLGGILVGDLGIYAWDGLARFQSVSTHPAYRRRGVCGTLIVEAAKLAKTQFGIARFVIVAESGSHAARIYENLGFNPVEKQIALTLSGD